MAHALHACTLAVRQLLTQLKCIRTGAQADLQWGESLALASSVLESLPSALTGAAGTNLKVEDVNALRQLCIALYNEAWVLLGGGERRGGSQLDGKGRITP